MKKINNIAIIGCLIVACLLTACGAQSEQAKEDTVESEPLYEFDPGEDYTLIWSDEFDGDTLDSTKWSYQYGDGGDYGIAGWGNGESQIYTDDPKNVSVSDGFLNIVALKEKLPSGATGYTSGRIRTVTNDGDELFSTVFGRVEARIMMEGGSGIWPAFWMLPVDESIYGKWSASGELDIMEVRGRVPDMSTGTAHFGKQWPNNTYQGGEYKFQEDSDVRSFHIYAIEWEPTEIRWYIDDQCFYTLKDWYSRKGANAADYTRPAPFDVPFYILLNVAVGGNFDPEAIISDESFPGGMTVDYVRVYQKKEGYDKLLSQATNSVESEPEDGPKNPLRSGESIYNGTFDQGINHVGYWKMDSIDTYVDPYDYKRKLNVEAVEGDAPRLYQTGLYMEKGSTYGVRVDTSAKETTSITVKITDDNGNVITNELIEVKAVEDKINAFKLENVPACENATFEIFFEKEARLAVDNIMLMKIQ